MQNFYKFHSYSDKFISLSNSTFVELSMTFMQVMPQSFEIPEFICNPEKDSYFLMFGISLQFLVLQDDLTQLDNSNELNIDLRKFRFSIMGTDTSSRENRDYSQYPLNYSFKDFIKDNYLKFVQKTHSFVNEKIVYKINELNHKAIMDGVQYLDRIFPNDKDIVIIDNIDADFYQAQNSGFNEGVQLYKNSTAFNQMQILKEKLPIKDNNLLYKKSKI